MSRQEFVVRVCILAVSLIVLASSTLLSAAAVAPVLDHDRIDAFFESQVAANRFTGLAVAITRGDRIIYLRGFGSAGDGRPVTPQTAFPIASASKSFAALAILQLAEQGKIDLDAPVQRYLPWWRIADAQASAAVTVRHLLTQTSGLGEDGYQSELGAESSLEDAVRDMRKAALVNPVGASFDYFDPNYFTLSLIVQALSGKPYAEYLRDNIFRPLGMANSTNIQVAGAKSNIARGSNPLFTIPLFTPEAIDQQYEVGCCGIVATAEDMAHYVIAHLNGGQYGGRQVLSAEGIQVLHTPQPAEGFPYFAPINYTGYGMGWFRRETAGTYVLEAPGSHRSYGADVLLLPEQGYGVVLLYNEGGLLTMLFGRQVIDGLVGLITGGQASSTLLSLSSVSLGLALLVLLTVSLEARALFSVRRWGERMRAAHLWRRALDAAWPLLLAALLFGMVMQLQAMFAWPGLDFFLWMPDIVGWLLLLAALNVLLGLARAWSAVRPGCPIDPNMLEHVAGFRGPAANKIL